MKTLIILLLSALPVFGAASLTTSFFQNVNASNVVSLTLDTGQGANELYDMDQNVTTTNSPSFVGLTLSGTGALQLPSGTTAEEPANAAGLIRWNTTTGRLEFNIGTSWKNAVRLDGDTMTGALAISSGALTLTGGSGGAVTASGAIQAGSALYLGLQSRARWYSSGGSAWQARNSGGTGGASVQFNLPVSTKTTNYVLTAADDSGLYFTNIGAAATNRLDLPTAAAGIHYYFYVDAAFNMQIQATGTDVIHDGAVASAAAGDIHSAVPYSTLHLFAPKTGHWVIDQKNGTWVGPQ